MIPNQHSLASSLGTIVWAKPTSSTSTATSTTTISSSRGSIYWPAEAIDPFNPPSGFKLLPEHILKLPMRERQQYLPKSVYISARPTLGPSAAAAPAPASAAATAAVDNARCGCVLTADASGGLEGDDSSEHAAGSNSPASSPDAEDGTARVPAAAGGGGGNRKVLLLWFGPHGCEWQFEQELLPFGPLRNQMKGRRGAGSVAA